jgi:hypothetical protein
MLKTKVRHRLVQKKEVIAFASVPGTLECEGVVGFA